MLVAGEILLLSITVETCPTESLTRQRRGAEASPGCSDDQHRRGHRTESDLCGQSAFNEDGRAANLPWRVR